MKPAFIQRDVETVNPSAGCGMQNYRCQGFYCQGDPSCQLLGFNHSTTVEGYGPCSCECQLCPNGKYYNGREIDYAKAVALTDYQRQQCPDIKAPCEEAE